MRTGGLPAVLAHYDELGDDFGEAVRSMLVFDAVIYNEDRHFSNFGILPLSGIRKSGCGSFWGWNGQGYGARVIWNDNEQGGAVLMPAPPLDD